MVHIINKLRFRSDKDHRKMPLHQVQSSLEPVPGAGPLVDAADSEPCDPRTSEPDIVIGPSPDGLAETWDNDLSSFSKSSLASWICWEMDSSRA